jgi:FixJ family two-component response regulator
MNGFTPDFSAGLPVVVLLENDNAVRRSLQLLLQSHGLDVKAYASPEPLLADPQGPKADCILSHCRLAGSDGITVIETLRKRGRIAPAVIMTTYGSDALTA